MHAHTHTRAYISSLCVTVGNIKLSIFDQIENQISLRSRIWSFAHTLFFADTAQSNEEQLQVVRFQKEGASRQILFQLCDIDEPHTKQIAAKTHEVYDVSSLCALCFVLCALCFVLC